MRSLDVVERSLAQRLKVVPVRSKSTRSIRKVHLIFLPHVQDAVEFLIQTRMGDSQFLFCNSKGKPMDGCKVFKLLTEECPDLIHPTLIRSRSLRKYIATTTQLMQLSDAELKLVADHLGIA